MNTVFAVDIGGTQIKAARVSDSGQVLAQRKVATPTTYSEFRNTAVQLTADLMPGAKAVGIGCKGMIEPNSTKVEALPGTLNFLEGHALREVFGISAIPVTADNDARVALRGEMRWGALQGHTDALLLTLGTGVGGGVVSGGRILQGATGLAGHLGHYTVETEGRMCICGNRGCLETVFSARAIEGEAFSIVHRGVASSLLEKIPRPSCEDVFRAAEAGDVAAAAIVNRAVHALAGALAGLAYIFDPQIIVLGGQIADAGEFLLAPLRELVRSRTYAMLRRELPVVRTWLDDPNGILGAAALAFDFV